MEIRLLQRDEGLLLRDLRLRAVTDSPDELGQTTAELQGRTDEWWVSHAREKTDRPDCEAVLLAQENETLSGLIYVSLHRICSTFAIADFAVMWIEPGLRRRGIGRKLLDTAISWAKERGATHLTLLVAEGNEGAIIFYQGAQFSKVWLQPKIVIPGSTQRFWKMERQLA